MVTTQAFNVVSQSKEELLRIVKESPIKAEAILPKLVEKYMAEHSKEEREALFAKLSYLTKNDANIAMIAVSSKSVGGIKDTNGQECLARIAVENHRAAALAVLNTKEMGIKEMGNIRPRKGGESVMDAAIRKIHH